MIDRHFRRRPVVLGHRGASAAAPENTEAAFRLAFEQGAGGVELDVRRTADGGLVVVHDTALAGHGPVVSLDLATIREIRPDIPTLARALAVCAGMLVNIEIKNWDAEPDWDPTEQVAEGVVDLVNRMAIHDDVVVSSFNPATVAAVRRLDPRVPTGLLVGPHLDPIAAVGQAAAAGHVALHPSVWSLAGSAAGRVVEAARGEGLLVMVWTVDDPEEIRRLAAAGVDGIIANDPGAALRALASPP